MIPIAKPLMGEEEMAAVREVLKSGILAQGPKVREFEDAFAQYIGVSHAIATSSGTAALHAALLAMGIKNGDEVITSPFSFIASANSVLYCGAKPVFADVREEDFNIDPGEIRKKITKKTRAVIPIHLYGLPADMDEINEIARDKGLLVLEDACQAHGAEYKGKKAGSIGDAAVFSFYPTKNMTTGEGGMITTNNDEFAEKARMLRDHGSRKKYLHEVLGFNFRMTSMCAAIGVEQLKKIEQFNARRIRNAEYLTKKLSGIGGLVLPKAQPGRKHVFHQFTIRVVKEEFGISRDDLIKLLNEKGVGTGVHYPVPIHKQPLYVQLGYKDSLPISEKLANEVVSLPIHPSVSESDLDLISEVLENAKTKGG
ncbi:MAG: DegT/DnrJ/EryC1/StrS family aminotransferase [Candidatus Micrarchaeota archaeon]